MEFQYTDLGQRTAGEIVVVTLSGNAANVRLLESSNFSSFKAGQQHRYYGGHATRSPVRLQIPNSGHWYIVIDFGGLSGSVRSSIQVLPGALNPIQDTIPAAFRPNQNTIPAAPATLKRIQDTPLSAVPSLVLDRDIMPGFDTEHDHREYDVFISHASEDKDAVVRPLANALRDGGLQVWYDEFELSIGDSLRRKIDAGLANSRFGIVILSQNFFRKGWTNYELDGIVTRAVTGEQILLPIWHNISKQEVIKYSPSLADKVARNTSTQTIDEIAAEIISVILKP